MYSKLAKNPNIKFLQYSDTEKLEVPDNQLDECAAVLHMIGSLRVNHTLTRLCGDFAENTRKFRNNSHRTSTDSRRTKRSRRSNYSDSDSDDDYYDRNRYRSRRSSSRSSNSSWWKPSRSNNSSSSTNSYSSNSSSSRSSGKMTKEAAMLQAMIQIFELSSIYYR